MENEELKAAVLAKCGELTPILFGNCLFEGKTIERTTHEIRIFADLGALRFSEKTPADDDVWPLAAQILHIESKSADTKDLMELGKSIAKTQELLMGMNEPRPSEGLLWEAFQEAKSVDYLAFGHLVAKQAKEKNREQFEKWIATLPPDPLAADKAAIQTEFANGLERKLIDAYCTGDAIAAIKRFAGMEVSNG